MAGIFSLSLPLPLTSDPGSYNCLPHAIVVNLATFFELWDAFAFHWVKSTQVALSDDDMHDVSRIFVIIYGTCVKLCNLQNAVFSFGDHEKNHSVSLGIWNMPDT